MTADVATPIPEATAMMRQVGADLQECWEFSESLGGHVAQTDARLDSITTMDEMGVDATSSETQIEGAAQAQSDAVRSVGRDTNFRTLALSNGLKRTCKPVIVSLRTSAETLKGYPAVSDRLRACASLAEEAVRIVSAKTGDSWQPTGEDMLACPKTVWRAAEEAGMKFNRSN